LTRYTNMSNTDVLRTSEAAFLPPGYLQDHVFELHIDDYRGQAEVDGFHPVSREAIEICQSETLGGAPKPGQKRKLASDVLKLIFLKEQGFITRGRVFVTSQEMYDWCQKSGSWLNAARKYYGVTVELHGHENKLMRKKIRNILVKARKEMR
jgi:hypothetical protein